MYKVIENRQRILYLEISNFLLKKKDFTNFKIDFISSPLYNINSKNTYNIDYIEFFDNLMNDIGKKKNFVILNATLEYFELKAISYYTEQVNYLLLFSQIFYLFNILEKNGSAIGYFYTFCSKVNQNLLKLLIKYFDKRMDLEFKICGCTNEEFYKKFKCKFKNVNCLGFIDNVEDILKETDIFILPSFHEGLSYSLMEAMSYGIFCIANNIPGINSLIIHNFSGILVNQNNAQRYIDIIEEISVKRDLLDKFKTNAKEIIKKFDRKIFLREYSNFLYKLQREIECL